MAVAFVSATEYTPPGGADPITFSHTVPSGANRLLIVSVGVGNTQGQPASAPTFNGVSMSELSHITSSIGAAGIDGYVWYLIAPDQTTANVVIDATGATRFACIASNFTGAHQTTPFGTVSEYGEGIITHIEAVGDDVASDTTDLVVDFLALRNFNAVSGLAPDGSQTEIHQILTTNSIAWVASSYLAGASPTTTMGWTWTGANRATWAGVAIKPAAAGVTATPDKADLTLTGHAPTSTGGTALITPGKADLALTGHAPTVVVTAGVNISPDLAQLFISGFAGPGNEGFPPTVTVTTGVLVSPNKADLALTGYAPAVVVTGGVEATPGKADLSLTGYAPVVTQTTDTYITPDKADLALTGHAPVVTKTEHVFVNPETGALVITGYAPTAVEASQSPTISPETAALVLEAFAPTAAVSGELISRTYRRRGRRIDWPDFLEEIRRLETKKEGLSERIAQAEGELAYAMSQKLINTLSSRITTLQRNLDSINAQMAELETQEMEDVAMIVSMLDDSIYD